MTSRPSTAAPILAVLAIVLMTLGMYVAGYFWLGKASAVSLMSMLNRGTSHELRRVYPHRWQAVAFRPLARIETWLRGETVKTASDDEFIIY